MSTSTVSAGREVKDSGVEWIGKIPKEWHLTIFRHKFFESNVRVKDDPSVTQILSVSGYRGVEKRDISSNEGQMPSEDVYQYRVVRPGELVVNTMWLNYAGLGVSKLTGYVSPAYRVYKIDESFEPTYIHYLMRSAPYIQKYSSLLYGIRPNSLQVKPFDFERIEILLPPRLEQKSIVSFLDKKNSKIDQYITNKQREIELLKECKKSGIAQRVIRGMNPLGAVKNSNIKWIGAVPADWQSVTVRAFARPRSIRGRPDLPLLSVYREYGVIRKDSRDDNINPDGQNLADYKVVEPGDLVLNKMKTWQGSMGVSSLHGIVSPAYIVCKIKGDINHRYLHLLLRSRPYVFEYNRVSYGVREGQWDMRYEDFKKIPVFLPSREEQDAIADFLDQKIIQIDALIQSAENSIERMNEFRQSLIADAVTGKITIPSVT